MAKILNGKKVHIHPITYVLVIVFLALVITAIVLFTPNKEQYFKKQFNNEVLKIIVDQKDKDGQAMQNHYEEITIKNTDKMYSILSPKTFGKAYDKNKLGFFISIQGGYYSKEFLLQFNLFLKELNEHALYKEEKYFYNKKPVQVGVILQNKGRDDQFGVIKTIYEKAQVDPYDYNSDVKAPIVVAYYKGNAINLDDNKQLFRNVANEYKAIITQAKTFLDHIQAKLDTLI